MSNIEKLFKEYNVTKDEQRKIMDIMDKYKERISDGVSVSSAEFENDIISVFGGYVSATRHTPAIEYHFCEFVAKDFMEDRRWEEVFVVLYGGFAKYGGKIENRS